LPAGRFLVLLAAKAWMERKAVVRLEGLGQLKMNRSHQDLLLPFICSNSVVELNTLLQLCTFPNRSLNYREWIGSVEEMKQQAVLGRNNLTSFDTLSTAYKRCV
jgi:hypothetical protein